MPLTIGTIRRESEGSSHVTYADVTFDSSYDTGGEALTPAQLGLRTVDFFDAENRDGYNFHFNRATNKLLAYNGTTQIANTTNLSTVTTRVMARGQL